MGLLDHCFGETYLSWHAIDASAPTPLDKNFPTITFPLWEGVLHRLHLSSLHFRPNKRTVSPYAPSSRHNPNYAGDFSPGACFGISLKSSESRRGIHALRRTQGRPFSGGHQRCAGSHRPCVSKQLWRGQVHQTGRVRSTPGRSFKGSDTRRWGYGLAKAELVLVWFRTHWKYCRDDEGQQPLVFYGKGSSGLMRQPYANKITGANAALRSCLAARIVQFRVRPQDLYNATKMLMCLALNSSKQPARLQRSSCRSTPSRFAPRHSIPGLLPCEW